MSILIYYKRLIILRILQILAVNQPLVLARVGHSRHRGSLLRQRKR
ncbi:hypothetical protein GM698_03435 [Mannheimia sp. ZY171111]|nr:hypothetical protein GM698_03435 [Mannheimia sp. ZY171111]